MLARRIGISDIPGKAAGEHQSRLTTPTGATYSEAVRGGARARAPRARARMTVCMRVRPVASSSGSAAESPSLS